jgi:hypothetical protein
MSKLIHIFQLYDLIDKKLKKAFPDSKYEKTIKKIDKMMGLIYGSITGLICGSVTQPLGPKAAEQRFKIDIPYCSIKDSNAVNDPVLGQLLSHVEEFKNAKWDANKYKESVNYKSVICNSTWLKVDIQPHLIEQIRTGKNAHTYNLSSEDFYLRVPICALFGDSTIDVVISKILQTHTSFEAPAYGLITASIIQLVLLNDTLLNISDWNQIIKEKLVPLLDEYYKIYTSSYFSTIPTTSEADKLRYNLLKNRLDEQYKFVHDQLISSIDMFEKINDNLIVENIDHFSEDEKEDMKITRHFSRQLDELKLDVKHSSHPMLLAIWCVKALAKIHDAIGLDDIEPSQLSGLILRSVAIKTGISSYNTMIVGSILGSIFGCTQIPEVFYEIMDDKLMDRINRNVLSIISDM